jgi:ADP-ribosyl-[dinitrogen reductase] hydrolase
MALCLAESLVERGGFDPIDQLQRYVRWYREGFLSSTGRCFDIGIATRQALERSSAPASRSPATRIRAPAATGR